ncbi:hypothetical protein ACCS53_39585, partial [Rhizobium ruizarguesonis]
RLLDVGFSISCRCPNASACKLISRAVADLKAQHEIDTCECIYDRVENILFSPTTKELQIFSVSHKGIGLIGHRKID